MYRKIKGSLIYLTISRPDLNYTMGLESHFMEAPRKPHLDVVKHTLCYMRATLYYALFYDANIELEFFGYTNRDWANSITYNSSTSGLMFSFGSVVVIWNSKKQLTRALLSIEIEYHRCNNCPM